jgi:hypothetical protein
VIRSSGKSRVDTFDGAKPLKSRFPSPFKMGARGY